MSGRMSRSAFTIALVALALAVRALLPAGWMPAGDGSLRLAMCNGPAPSVTLAEIAQHRADGAPLSVALARAAWDRSEGKAPPLPAPAPDHPCAFAGAAAVADLTTTPMLDVPVFAAVPPTVARLRDVVAGRGLPAPPPPATGPPILA